jgi:endonuclease/exonuclease/phosphatase (EEP) superfamily protein YafD
MEREGLARRLLVRAEWAYGVVLVSLAVLTHWWELDWFGLWLIATFFPYWFAPGLLISTWALVRRQPRRHLPALAVTLCFLALYGRQLVPGLPREDPTAVTVMTYNVGGARSGPEDALRVIQPERPQLLALQEVGPRRAAGRDLVSRLEAAGYQCEHRPYYADTTFGVAVCVLPPVRLIEAQRRTYREHGEWSYLFAEIAWQGRVVNMVVPHLLSYRIGDVEDHLTILRRVVRASRWHRQETAALLELIRGFHDPTVMAGDFNSTPEHAIHARLRRRMRDAFRSAGFGFGTTYRYLLPIRIDYVYVGPQLEVLDARVGLAGPSDHRPVIARVRLSGQGGPE